MKHPLSKLGIVKKRARQGLTTKVRYKGQVRELRLLESTEIEDEDCNFIEEGIFASFKGDANEYEIGLSEIEEVFED